MSKLKPGYIMCQPLDWADLRLFLIKRPWVREYWGDTIYDAIKSRETEKLDPRLMRELSVWVDGYKGGGDEQAA